MLKHYVEYMHPGFIMIESSIAEIEEREAKKVKLPEGCVGFRFFDRNAAVVNGEICTGEKKNISHWYYDGEKMTIKEVREKYGNDESYSNVIANMEDNGYNAIVKTKFGNFLPLRDGDTII